MVKKDLMMLGYRMEETDFWKLMGIAKLEGPEPDKAVINRRVGVLSDLLGTLSDAMLEPAEQSQRARWICKIVEAEKTCLEELREVQKLRKTMKLQKDRLPRWAEADANVVEHIIKEVQHPSACMLQLSNILRSRNIVRRQTSN